MRHLDAYQDLAVQDSAPENTRDGRCVFARATTICADGTNLTTSTAATAEVHKAVFRSRPCAVKTFRNSEKKKSLKEVQLLFELRHTCVIGIYAWFEHRDSIGIVMEFAEGGELRSFYNGEEYSIKHGMTIALDTAKGIARKLDSSIVSALALERKSGSLSLTDSLTDSLTHSLTNSLTH